LPIFSRFPSTRKAFVMNNPWDDFSRSLAEGSMPRRKSLRLLGAALAGAVLSPLGMGTAWGAKPRALGQDPCKAFCRCSNKQQQNACLAACRACTNPTGRLCGSCGSGFACTDLANDVSNCGGCYNSCQPGPYEEAACVSGACVYSCAEGAANCDGTCTYLDSDPNNCGACGGVCDASGPNGTRACVDGRCVYGCASGTIPCNGVCTPVLSDPNNCGACGNVCNGSTPYCSNGACTDCAGGAICEGHCTDLNWDPNNCGGCGNVCPAQFGCAFGACEGICYNCY